MNVGTGTSSDSTAIVWNGLTMAPSVEEKEFLTTGSSSWSFPRPFLPLRSPFPFPFLLSLFLPFPFLPSLFSPFPFFPSLFLPSLFLPFLFLRSPFLPLRRSPLRPLPFLTSLSSPLPFLSPSFFFDKRLTFS